MKFVLLLLLVSTTIQAEIKKYNEKEFSKMKPVKFLNHLHTHCCGAVTLMAMPKNWITKKDVKELKKYLNDNRQASSVVSMISSIPCNERSTVKEQAQYLIDGFAAKRYPPNLGSCVKYLKIKK